MLIRPLPFILTACLGIAPAQEEGPPRIKPRVSAAPVTATAVSNWPERIATADPGSKDEAWAQADFDHSGWKTMKLPVHWENAGLPDYDGVVWFRRTIDVPASIADRDAVLGLGAIDDMDVTWVNGVRVGGYEKPGAHFTPRNYKLPKGALRVGSNIIAVRVMDHGAGGGMAQTHGRMELRGGGHALPLTGPWHYQPGANLAQLLRPSTPDGSPAPRLAPFQGKFELQPHDVIAFAGGTNMVRQFESGHLESVLTWDAEHPVYFRDLAWQADTVYQQQRPRSFGTHLDLLDRMSATVMVANFGQMEALDGATELPQFLKAYGELLDEFEKRTPRIVLIAPHRFEKTDNALLPDLSKRNGDLDAYSQGIRQLAKRRGFLFVDLAQLDPTQLTSDGVNFNETGRWAWAQTVAAQLTGAEVSFQANALESSRKLIQRKNTLWRQHWRPTNWSFLYGNRQHVPSSKDHRPGKPRWFPEEVNAIIPMIENAEAKIWKQKVEGRK